MKIVVIGAGVAGMCAALRLAQSRQVDGSEIVVLEKAARPGGLLQSTLKDGYWWDNGAFKFGRTNFLATLMPDLFEAFDGYAVKVWQGGRLHPFPFDLKAMLLTQSAREVPTLGMAYLHSRLRRRLGPPAVNLHDWLSCCLPGRLLEKSQIGTYIGKLQGQPPSALDPAFGELRLKHMEKRTRPGNLVGALLKASRKSRKGRGTRFIYPSGPGVGSISRRLATLCEARGIQIKYETEVKQIDPHANQTVSVHCRDHDTQHTYPASYVISTMPLDDLATACRPWISDESLAAAATLRYMDLKLAFFTLRRISRSDRYLTVYSFDPHHPWKRLVARRLPDHLTSVLVEITFDPRNGEPQDDLLDQVQRQLTEELKLFASDDIVLCHTATVRNAYPIYDIGFDTRVKRIIRELERERLRTAGRQGRFLYTSTPGVIQTALDAADAILRAMSRKKTPDPAPRPHEKSR